MLCRGILGGPAPHWRQLHSNSMNNKDYSKYKYEMTKKWTILPENAQVIGGVFPFPHHAPNFPALTHTASWRCMLWWPKRWMTSGRARWKKKRRQRSETEERCHGARGGWWKLRQSLRLLLFFLCRRICSLFVFTWSVWLVIQVELAELILFLVRFLWPLGFHWQLSLKVIVPVKDSTFKMLRFPKYCIFIGDCSRPIVSLYLFIFPQQLSFKNI